MTSFVFIAVGSLTYVASVCWDDKTLTGWLDVDKQVIMLLADLIIFTVMLYTYMWYIVVTNSNVVWHTLSN